MDGIVHHCVANMPGAVAPARLLTLDGGKHQAGHHEEPRNHPYEPCHLDVSHAGALAQTMSNRSVWMRASGTPSSISAVSAASIMGPGPQMKN